MPLESELDNGDVVEVFTSKAQNAGPSRDWLTFVKSPRARNKIKQFFTKERREEAIEQGKEALARLMRREGLPLQRMLTHETLSVVASELHHPDVTALYAAVGEGNTTAQTVVRRILELFGATRRQPTRPPRRSRSPASASAASSRRAATPASSSRASPTSGSSSPAAARRCRATRSSAS